MGSAITQPIKRFFSKDKIEQSSSTNNGNSSEKGANGSESSDDDSAPAESKESEISSGESTCTILSSEDEEPPKPENTSGDPREPKEEVKENNISDKDDLWSKVENYENKVREKELGVTCDDSKTENEDSRPNIFDLRYKSCISEDLNEPAIEGNENVGQLGMNGTPPSEQKIVKTEPDITTSQTPGPLKDHTPEHTQSKIPGTNPLPSHTVLRDEVVKSPGNNNRPTSSRNYNKNSYHHNIEEKSPADVKDSTWMKNQVRNLYSQDRKFNTLRTNNDINYRNGPSLGTSVFTLLKAKRAMSSNPDSKIETKITKEMPKEVSLPKDTELLKQNKSQQYNNSNRHSVEKNTISSNDSKTKTTITKEMPKEVSLPKDTELFKQNNSQQHNNSNRHSVEKNTISSNDSKTETTITKEMPKEVSLPKDTELLKQNKSQHYNSSSRPNVEKNISFNDWYPLPGGGYKLYEKHTDPDSHVNTFNIRETGDQYGIKRQASDISRKATLKEFDIYRFRSRTSAVKNGRVPVNYQSKSLHTTSELSSEKPVPESRVTDH